MFSTIMDVSNELQQDVNPEKEVDDVEGVDEEEPSPPDVLKVVVVEELVTKCTLPPRCVVKGNSMKSKFTVKYCAWLGFQAAKEKSHLEATQGKKETVTIHRQHSQSNLQRGYSSGERNGSVVPSVGLGLKH